MNTENICLHCMSYKDGKCIPTHLIKSMTYNAKTGVVKRCSNYTEDQREANE